MTTLTSVRDTDPWRRRLYLPAYRVGDVARYTHTTARTIENWHYRETDSGITLPGRERRRPLSYLELVEVAIVAIFRHFGVPLASIRRTRDYFAQTFQEEYPFAVYRFKTDGFHLLMNLKEFEPDVDIERLIVADRAGQLGWERMMADRLFEFDYEEELAIKWHVAGRQSPVLIDPRVAFGAPMVRGIPTWVLKGRWTAGESIEDIKVDFELESEEIQHGLEFEGIEFN